nr:MAG TPA: dUTPase [Caudoviricetes sp.]
MKEKYNMQIKYELDEGACVPMRTHDSDAGFDLSCMEDQILEPKVTNVIDTGVHILIPEGYVGLVCPRSSFNVKGIGTPIGVIDSGYTGSIRVVLEPFNVTKIFKGNRIAQLVILPLPNIKMIEGKVIGVDTHRGDGGFGSTGE